MTRSFNYVLRIINPKRKSDAVTRTWHNMHKEFSSPETLRENLMDTFSVQVPEDTDFSIGYYAKPGNSKRWIEINEDLKAMYKMYKHDSTVNLWCDGRIEDVLPSKRSSDSNTNDRPNNKRARREDEIDDIFETLREKHENFSDPQLRLWACMYVNGFHKDLDNPHTCNYWQA